MAINILHGEPFRFFRQGGIEFPHFGNLLVHIPCPQVFFRPSASIQKVIAIGF